MKAVAQDMRDGDRGETAVDVVAELASLVLPGLGAGVKALSRPLRQEWARKGSRALEAAEISAGRTREEIREAVAQDPRLVPLVTRLLYAAGMNGHDRTLAAMGTVFGHAIRVRDSLGECELILASLTDLTELHASVLIEVSKGTREEEDQPRQGLSVGQLVEACSLPERVVLLGVSALVARGLVRINSDFFGGMFYTVTDLGTLLLDVLEQYTATQRGDG